MAEWTRQEFLRGMAAAGAGLAAMGANSGVAWAKHGKRPRAITMWDFSWLERRWPGAGYEDWDQALDELVERGYDAVRIDPYPHLVAADPGKSWLLNIKWEVQDWGAPSFVRVQIMPDLLTFIRKCGDRGIKVGLSSWYRDDEDHLQAKINDGLKMAAAWIATLRLIADAGLLDHIFYVDLCNEWGNASTPPYGHLGLPWGQWYDPRSLAWMREAVAEVRAAYPQLPILFSFDNSAPQPLVDNDISFMDALELHIWMVGENDDEFFRTIDYSYDGFSTKGYHALQLKGEKTYHERSEYWQHLLTDKIGKVAAAARKAHMPLMTTESWGVINYKDWPLLPWDWVKDLCALGTLTASATGQWLAISTSNFCGPQFRGMWRDVAWHKRLTDAIKAGPMDPSVRSGRLWNRL